MNRTAGNRSGLLAVLLIVVGIPVAVLGYQYGLRPMLSEHRIIDVEARTPEDGGFSPDTIRVDVGETVTLRVSAEDVTHGIAIGPGLGLHEETLEAVRTMIEVKLAVNSNAAPRATSHDPVPRPHPAVHSGGTSEMPIAVPAAADAVSPELRTVV